MVSNEKDLISSLSPDSIQYRKCHGSYTIVGCPHLVHRRDGHPVDDCYFLQRLRSGPRTASGGATERGNRVIKREIKRKRRDSMLRRQRGGERK